LVIWKVTDPAGAAVAPSSILNSDSFAVTAPPDAAVDGGATEAGAEEADAAVDGGATEAGGAAEAAGVDGVAALEHPAATSAATASAATRDDRLERERCDIWTDPRLDACPGDLPGNLSSIVHRVACGVL
jgi:hypothetical protein